MKPWSHRRPESSQLAFFVVGHFGAPNLGDEAMLLGLVSGLSRVCGHRLVVSTRTGRVPPAVSAFRTVTARRRGLFLDLLGALRTRNVILCGGSHFHDAFAGTRLLYHYASIVRYLLVSAVARAAGGRVLWLGVGFGPLDRPAARTMCRIGCLLADEIVVRDESSLQTLRGLQPGARARVGFDLAALLDVTPHQPPVAKSHSLTIGVAPASVSHGAGTGRPLAFYERLGQQLADISETKEIRVKLFVFSGGGVDSDRDLVVRLAETWRGRHSLRCEVVDRADDPLGVIAEIGACDVVVASRFHAVLLSFLAGRPVLAVAYHEKVRQLAAEIGLDGAVVKSLDDVVTSDELLCRPVANPPRSAMSAHEARARAAENIVAVVGRLGRADRRAA